jgi:hypothetical protein
MKGLPWTNTLRKCEEIGVTKRSQSFMRLSQRRTERWPRWCIQRCWGPRTPARGRRSRSAPTGQGCTIFNWVIYGCHRVIKLNNCMHISMHFEALFQPHGQTLTNGKKPRPRYGSMLFNFTRVIYGCHRVINLNNCMHISMHFEVLFQPHGQTLTNRKKPRPRYGSLLFNFYLHNLLLL